MTRGSLLIEIILWLAFIVPGLIYTVWRHTSRYAACSACGANELVPVTTPGGRELLAKYHPGVAAPAAPAPDDDLPRGNAKRGYVYLVILAVIVLAIIYSAF